AETVSRTQFKFGIHLDCFERTHLDANLAAHAYRNIDVEYCGIELRFAHVIGLPVLAFDDVNALRRAFLFANLARYAAQARVWVLAIDKQERKVARGFLLRQPFLWILDVRQPLFFDITAQEISGGLAHAFN